MLIAVFNGHTYEVKSLLSNTVSKCNNCSLMGTTVSIFKKVMFLQVNLYVTVSVVRNRKHATKVPEVLGHPTARGIHTLLKFVIL